MFAQKGRVGILFLAVAMAGCSHAPARKIASSPARPNANTGKYCAVEETRSAGDGSEPLIVCQQLFSERPFLHLDSVRYQGKYAWAAGVLLGGNGAPYELVTADRNRIKLVSEGGVPLKQLPGLANPGLKSLFTIYEVLGTAKPGNAIKVRAVREKILVTGCAMDGLFAGTWTGKLTKRNLGPGKPFDWFNATAPVHFTVRRMEEFDSMIDLSKPTSADHTSYEKLADGKEYKLVATIDNLERDYAGKDKVVFPSLTDLEDENPLKDANSNEVAFMRYTSMHTPGDYQLGVDFPKGTQNTRTKYSLSYNGMTMQSSMVITLENLISSTNDPEVAQGKVYGHGMPNGFMIGELQLEHPGDYSRVACPR